MCKKFTLLLASRARPELLTNLLKSISINTKNLQDIEIFIGIDDDDSITHSIKQNLENQYTKFFSRPRSQWMHRDYINPMFAQSSGKYILVLNDDTEINSPNWDVNSFEKLELYLKNKPDRIVYATTQDDTNAAIACFPLFSREACLAAGWVLPNERPNWGADSDAKEIYSQIGRVFNLPEISVKHISHHNQTRKRDDISLEIEKVFRKHKSSVPNIQFYANKIKRFMTTKKILVVYNICELAGKENYDYYIPAIQSILSQEFDSFKVAVSGCKVSYNTKQRLKLAFGSNLFYNWIEEVLPLNTTFNHTVKKCFERGDFESVVYVDSGVTLGENKKILQKMWDRNNGDYGMITYRVDSDMGFDQWKIKPPHNTDMIVPLGKAINLHLQLFPREFYEQYGERILPDVFASDTSESIFTFMCAAINKKWVMTHETPAVHLTGLDGPSVGFRNKKPLLFRTEKNINQICAQGINVGFGYEECRPVLKHNPACYENDKHKNPEVLKEFIKNYCFIEDNNFYNSINHNFEELMFEQFQTSITCFIRNSSRNKDEAVQSVINQSFKDWKLVVDGDYYDPRIVKSSDYFGLVMHLNENDILYPNAFESIIDFFNKNHDVKALCASKDIVSVEDGEVFYLGEYNSTEVRGCCVGKVLEGVSSFQMIVRSDVAKYISKIDFANEIGGLFPVFPLETKIGMERRF